MSARTDALRAPRAFRPQRWLAAGIAVVTVAIVVTVVMTPKESTVGAGAHPSLWAGVDIQAVKDAGYTGRAGAATVQAQTLMERLVNAGVVPLETLQPQQVQSEPLYTRRELALMAAVAGGQVPKEALDDETFLIKSLVNQGLIPREAATG